MGVLRPRLAAREARRWQQQQQLSYGARHECPLVAWDEMWLQGHNTRYDNHHCRSAGCAPGDCHREPTTISTRSLAWHASSRPIEHGSTLEKVRPMAHTCFASIALCAPSKILLQKLCPARGQACGWMEFGNWKRSLPFSPHFSLFRTKGFDTVF